MNMGSGVLDPARVFNTYKLDNFIVFLQGIEAHEGAQVSADPFIF